ncbi:MAG TPA: FecR family protein, partial [Spirochaetia bacterium]|nr:FecR family protein [Spirochaetia bacterium]
RKNLVVRLSIGCLLFLCTGMMLSAAPVVGKIVSLDGTVDVYRNGKVVDWRLVTEKFNIEEYDLIETGEDGLVEVEVSLKSGARATVRMSENTAFYFETSKLQGKDQTNFQMMKGSLALKVAKLSGSESVGVKTESTAMGVRGTEFEVITMPDGAVLVLCSEGRVACTDNRDQEVLAEAGRVVSKNPNESLKGYAVEPEDLPTYREFWTSTRLEIFKSGADVFVKAYAKQYEEYLKRFTANYGEMLKQRAILEKYTAPDSGAPLGTLIQVKTQVSPAMFAMRSVYPLFEQTFYRLTDLERFHRQGYGRVMIRDRYSSDAFFSNFSARETAVKEQLAMTRYMFKLFAALSEMTGGGLGAEMFMSNPLAPEGSIPGTGGGGFPSGNIPSGQIPSGGIPSGGSTFK